MARLADGFYSLVALLFGASHFPLLILLDHSGPAACRSVVRKATVPCRILSSARSWLPLYGNAVIDKNCSWSLPPTECHEIWPDDLNLLTVD